MPNASKIRLLLEARDQGASATVGRVTSSLNNYRAVALGAVAVGGAVIGGLAAITKNYLDNADALQKLSIRTGQEVEELSALTLAFRQADLSASDIERTFTRLNERGLELDEVADTFQSLGSQVEKTNFLVDTFGERLGPRLATVLNEGSEGLDNMRMRAQELGFTMSGEAADDAAYLNDRIDDLRAALEGASFEVAQALVPSLINLADVAIPHAIRFSNDLSKTINVLTGNFERSAVRAGSLLEIILSIGEANFGLTPREDAVGEIRRMGLAPAPDETITPGNRRYLDTFGPGGSHSLYGRFPGASPDPTDYQSIYTHGQDPFGVLARGVGGGGSSTPVTVDIAETLKGPTGGMRIDGADLAMSIIDQSKADPIRVLIAGFGGIERDGQQEFKFEFTGGSGQTNHFLASLINDLFAQGLIDTGQV